MNKMYSRLFWGCKDNLISDVLLRSFRYGHTRAGRPTKTYIQMICGPIGCSLYDLCGTMGFKDGLQVSEWVRETERDRETPCYRYDFMMMMIDIFVLLFLYSFLVLPFLSFFTHHMRIILIRSIWSRYYHSWSEWIRELW